MRFSAGKRPWSFGRGLWLLLACIVHLPGGAAALDDIGSRISGLLAERGDRGAVWALHGPDHADTIGAAGLRQAGLAERGMPDDRFQVGSIAKPVLAVSVLRLVTQQRISLDTPIHDILPEVGHHAGATGNRLRERNAIGSFVPPSSARSARISPTTGVNLKP